MVSFLSPLWFSVCGLRFTLRGTRASLAWFARSSFSFIARFTTRTTLSFCCTAPRSFAAFCLHSGFVHSWFTFTIVPHRTARTHTLPAHLLLRRLSASLVCAHVCLSLCRTFSLTVCALCGVLHLPLARARRMAPSYKHSHKWDRRRVRFGLRLVTFVYRAFTVLTHVTVCYATCYVRLRLFTLHWFAYLPVHAHCTHVYTSVYSPRYHYALPLPVTTPFATTRSSSRVLRVPSPHGWFRCTRSVRLLLHALQRLRLRLVTHLRWDRHARNRFGLHTRGYAHPVHTTRSGWLVADRFVPHTRAVLCGSFVLTLPCCACTRSFAPRTTAVLSFPPGYHRIGIFSTPFTAVHAAHNGCARTRTLH